LQRIFHSSKREITTFGGGYTAQPASHLSAMSQRADEQYNQLYSSLVEKFGVTKVSELSELPLGTLGAIKGVQATGTLGNRGMQLGAQMAHFDNKEVHDAMAHSLDSNKGLDRLRFWMNLYKQIESDPKLGDYLRENNFRLKGYLGGGSLYTTYEGLLTIDGKDVEVAVKVLNTNAEGFIGSMYGVGNAAFTEVAQHSEADQIKQAGQFASELLDLSNEWTIKEITSSTKETDHKRFEKVVEAFSSRAKNARLYVPKLRYLSQRVIIEDKAKGKTVNQFMADTEVDVKVKNQVIKTLRNFFEFQLRHPVKEGDGEWYQIHPDNHLGNFMVDHQPNQPLSIAVIDQVYTMKLSKEEVTPFRGMSEKTSTLSALRFLTLLIDRCLTKDKEVKPFIRAQKTLVILNEVRIILRESKQKALDPWRLAQTVNQVLKRHNLSLSLEQQILLKDMISARNYQNFVK
jgi:hypothetical protein